MTVNTLSQEVSTFKIFCHKNLHYMKKQLVCARHLQFVELKMAELYSFQICV